LFVKDPLYWDEYEPGCIFDIAFFVSESFGKEFEDDENCEIVLF